MCKVQEKGHLAFNCPPKYNNKTRKIPSRNNKDDLNKTEYNKSENKEQAANVSEFAGLTYYKNQHKNTTKNYKHNHISRNHNQNWDSSKSYLHHKLRLYRLCKHEDTSFVKENFYHLYFQDNTNIYKTIIKEMTKQGHYN